ncbi:MAG: hypothetical protein QM831_39895 [Kofleriaceae bacterium]
MAFDDLAKRMATTHGKQVKNDGGPTMLEFAQTGWDNKRRDAILKLVLGILMTLGGLVFTLATFMLAASSPTGGTFWIMGGLFCGGIAEIGIGIGGLRRLGPRPSLPEARVL